jgi:hypothetical protein
MRTLIARSLSRTVLRPAAILLCSISALVLVGCGTMPFADTSAHSLSITGTAFGGQPPVTGSTITLYATGGAGYGSAPSGLATTTTDAHGNFQINNAPSCGDPEQVYIVASGGNPGLTAGTNNTALTLVAALGNCSSVSASTHVIINEVTTIAAAYALSGFASPTTIDIGTSATNPTGLQHAFLNAANIVDSSSGSARGTTPAGNGTVPTNLINSLADILEPCVNSTSKTSTACTTLFTNAKPPSVTGVATPANTWQAALDMAQYPGNNTATLYGLILGTPSFQPTLGSTAPNDLSIGVLYRAGLETDGATEANNPWGIAVDANDNVWITGMTNAGLMELSSNGTLQSTGAGGFGNTTLKSAFTHQVAVDLHGNVLTVDSAASGNIYVYNPTSAVTTVITPGVLALSGVAVDSSNNLWFATQAGTTGNSFGQLAYNSGSSTFATALTPFTGNSTTTGSGVAALTVDATNGNVWGPSQSTGTTNYFLTPYTSTVPESATTGDVTNYAAAIDKSSNIWITGPGTGVNGSQLFMITHGNPAGVPASYSPTVTSPGTPCGPLHGCGLYNARSVMIDGSNRLFVSSYGAGMIVEFDPSLASGTFLLTAAGNGFNPSSNTSGTGIISVDGARTIAIDAAGALWTINGVTTAPPTAPVVQVLGIAAPTVSVLAQAKYGAKP